MLRPLYYSVRSSPLAPLLRVPVVERAHQRVKARPCSAKDVRDLLDLLDSAGVRGWLVGGWGCDALLGHQTRAHSDLDVIVSREDGAAACHALEQAGFYLERTVEGARWMPLQLEWKDVRRSVGLHPVDFGAWCAEQGWSSMREMARAIGVADLGEIFVAGQVGGRTVPCVSAKAQLILHCGYDLHERDHRDLGAISERFRLPMPPADMLSHRASGRPVREAT